jgi:hypothetical protein
LVRPVREQLEHDRIIRLLQARSRRRHEVAINPGSEQNAPVGAGPRALYPDVVLYSQERGRRVEGVVEVETGESVNHLEALAQWAHFARLKVPFHLYVPAATIDVARRLSLDHQIPVAELWIYDNIGDQVRFTLVQKTGSSPAARQAVTPRAATPARAAAPRPAAPPRPAAQPRATAQPRTPVRPASRASAARKAKTARPAKAAAKRTATARKGSPRKATPAKSAAQKRR